MFVSETAEEFKNRVENGLGKKTSYRNYFATLQPRDRLAKGSLTVKVQGEKRLTKEARIELLKKLL